GLPAANHAGRDDRRELRQLLGLGHIPAPNGWSGSPRASPRSRTSWTQGAERPRNTAGGVTDTGEAPSRTAPPPPNPGTGWRSVALPDGSTLADIGTIYTTSPP